MYPVSVDNRLKAKNRLLPKNTATNSADRIAMFIFFLLSSNFTPIINSMGMPIVMVEPMVTNWDNAMLLQYVFMP